MTTGKVIVLLAVLASLAGMVGCHDDHPNVPHISFSTPKQAASAKSGPTPEELTMGMVEAVPQGKSTMPMSVKFDLPSRPQVGQPLDVVVALLPGATGSASIQVTGSPGLTVAPEAGTVAIPAVEPTQAYRLQIATTPTADGVQLLALNVTLTHDETTESRSFVVPVIVGAVASDGSLPKH